MTLPLEKIKVLDFSRFLPGPFAAMMLGDFGADIIRVEEPGAGSQLTGRRAEQSKGAVVRPLLSGDPLEITRPYDEMGRNKRSIVLNLKDSRAQDIARKLAAGSDVLIEEFRPGVTTRLGIDYPAIKKINDRIIYCSISLYGQNGPYKNHPGHDPCSLAIAGVLSLCADENGTPGYLGFPACDISSALHAVIGILMALKARDINGQGQHVDISMTDSALDFMALASQKILRGKKVARMNVQTASAGVFQCRDGKWICTTNLEPHHWANFCRSIGREDFIPHQFNKERRSEMLEAVRAIIRTRTHEEWLKIFWGENESQAAPVNEPGEVFDDPQVQARDMALELDHPAGKVKQLGISVKLSQTPGKVRFLAPLPGSDTRRILSGLGYPHQEIEQLYQQAVVG